MLWLGEYLPYYIHQQNHPNAGIVLLRRSVCAFHAPKVAPSWLARARVCANARGRPGKYGETDEDTALKVEKCQEAGLKANLVEETLPEQTVWDVVGWDVVGKGVKVRWGKGRRCM